MAKQGDPQNPSGGKPAKPSRRRVMVEGEEEKPAIEMPKKAQPRSLQDILGDPSKGAEDGPKPDGPVWDPGRLHAFLQGRITLGDLEGITKQEQYEMAKIGFSYLSSGKLDQAKTVFDGLVALDPYDAYFHTALGSIAQQKNDLIEAERRYSRALEINPFSPVAFANRGEVRVMQGRLAEGAQDLVRALEEDPNAVQPSTVRARATIQVVKEHLEKLDLPPLPKTQTGSKIPTVVTKAQTGSKIPAATTGPKAPAPAAKAAPAPAAKPAAQAAPPAKPAAAAEAKKTGEQKKPATTTGEHKKPATTTGEHKKPATTTGEHKKPATTTGELKKPNLPDAGSEEPKAQRATRPPPRRPPPKKK